jgi:hypothetical protein
VKKICGNKIYNGYIFFTKANKFWENLESKWYVPRTDHHFFKRTKIVPKDIKLTPLSLCIWYMDDGFCGSKDANITLCTNGFTKEEVEFLIERLKIDLDINSKIKKRRRAGKEQYQIFIGRKEYFKFMEIIRPHIEWECFKYKTDITSYNKLSKQGETNSCAKLKESDVYKMFELYDEGWTNQQLKDKYHLTSSLVSLILAGKRWKHLGLKRNIVDKPRITKEQKELIVKLGNQNMTQENIAKEVNTSGATVCRVLQSYNKCKEKNSVS